MNWILMLWPMAAGASLTLALGHFWRWLGQQDERANLLFSVAATATAGVALFELIRVGEVGRAGSQEENP